MTRPRRVVTCAAAIAVLIHAAIAMAQVTGEADVTVGHSTQGVNAAGTQIRLFGPVSSEWRVWLEATWAGNYGERESDAFGSAYPYDRRLRPMEVYAERSFSGRGRLATLRVGRARLPFGISGRSEHAYGGFTRAPLIRYGQNWALSNNFMSTGVDALIGRPSLSVEGSVGVSQDEGADPRPESLDLVVRGQGYTHSTIIGVSHMRSRPSMSGPFVHGPMQFSGIDARWMRGGLMLRGEWIAGRPFDGVKTRGGYVDAIVHHTGMGPVTLVGRVERLDYFAGPFSDFFRRAAVGGRYQATRALGAQVNVIHQPHGLAGGHTTALDTSVTYPLRF